LIYLYPGAARGSLVKAIEAALYYAALGGNPGIAICRGEEKGCVRPQLPCEDCHRAWIGELKTSEQIAREMERGHG